VHVTGIVTRTCMQLIKTASEVRRLGTEPQRPVTNLPPDDPAGTGTGESGEIPAERGSR